MDIYFTCTIQPRQELPDTACGSVIQLSGRPTLISIAGVPEDKLINGLPSANIIWQAEAAFLERQGELYPEHHVIAWEAHYENPVGPVLSHFRVLLPAQEV